MLNVGIMGVWHVHTRDYEAQLLQSGRARIVAVWDEDPQVGQAWAQEHGVPFVQELEAFLALEAMQAVVCVAPTTRHETLLTKAAQAGKHIYTEKLLATKTDEAERICQAVEKAGVICTVSLPLLSDKKILYVRDLIEKGALGRVTGARMRRSHSGVSDNWLPERWFDVSRSGGGAMMDLGAHPVYVLSYLLGKPVRVSGMMTNILGTSSDENAIALVEYENGVLGTCETAFVTNGVPDLLEVYGTEGAVYMRGEQIEVATKAMGQVGVGATKPSRLPESLPSPIEQFLTACLEGTSAPAHLTCRDALVMTRIIAAAYVSDEKRVTITL